MSPGEIVTTLGEKKNEPKETFVVAALSRGGDRGSRASIKYQGVLRTVIALFRPLAFVLRPLQPGVRSGRNIHCNLQTCFFIQVRRLERANVPRTVWGKPPTHQREGLQKRDKIGRPMAKTGWWLSVQRYQHQTASENQPRQRKGWQPTDLASCMLACAAGWRAGNCRDN